jgi:hypothetical protein
MPYISAGRLRRALDALLPYHPLLGITFLCMKQCELPVGTTASWSSAQETEFLNRYYKPPGAPPKKPYFSPFGREEGGSKWRAERYSSTSLQSARTRQDFRLGLEHPPRSSLWGFKPGYVDVFANQLPQDEARRKRKLPVFDLAAWLFRDRDLPGNFNELAKLFRRQFKLVDDNEFEKLFVANQHAEDAANFFADSPIDDDELVEIVAGIPLGPSLGARSEADLLKAIEDHIFNDAHLSLPAGFVANFFDSLKAQRFVILAGRPGTGKTAFARAYANALKSVFPEKVIEIVVSIGQDFTEADTIGYEKIAGGLAATKLTSDLFLSGRPRDIYVILLEEMNLAEADYYLARLLPAIESNVPIELPGGGEEFAREP